MYLAKPHAIQTAYCALAATHCNAALPKTCTGCVLSKSRSRHNANDFRVHLSCSLTVNLTSSGGADPEQDRTGMCCCVSSSGGPK